MTTDRPRGPRSRRISLNTTVAPKTLDRLGELSAHYNTSQGRILDRLVDTLSESVKDGRVRCIHGAGCIAQRADMPAVF
jgi:hypothetical protein